jgi:DNA-binding beta-propeller fold protein YncE
VPAGPAPAVRQSAAQDTVGFAGRAESFTVTPDGSRLYAVGSADLGPAGAARVLRGIDARTGASADLLTVSGFDMVGRPTVSPDGSRVYVTVNWDLVTFDTATGRQIARVTTPDQPRPGAMTQGGLHGVTVSPDGARVYLAQYGPYGIRMGSRAGRVLAYDTATRTFTGTATLTGYDVNPVVLGSGGTDAWVGTADSLYHLDVRGAAPQVVDRVQDFGYGDEVVPTPDGRTVYASGHRGAGTVDVLDPEENTFRTAFSTGSAEDGARLLGASPDSRRLYVLAGGRTAQAALLAYDTATDTAVPGETVTGFGLDSVTQALLGADGHTLYLLGPSGADRLLRIVRF